MLNEGEIIRVRSHNNFTIIPNQIFADTRLSARAMGVLCCMLHFPNNWKFNKRDMHQYFTEGRDAVIVAWDELEAAGYIVSTMLKDYTGKIRGYRHIVYDTSTIPLPENPDTVLLSGKPAPEKPAPESQALHNTILVSTDNTNIPLLTNSNEFINNGAASKSTGKAKEKKKKESPPSPGAPPAEKDTIYPALMKIYYEWFQSRNNGVPPKIDGTEGKALKAIISYLKVIVNTKHPDAVKDDKLYIEQGGNILLYIFSKWHVLDLFTQKQTKLSQISSNISNIIDYLKNAKQQATKGVTSSPEQRAESVNNAVNEFINR